MATLVDDSGTTRFEGTITGVGAAPGASTPVGVTTPRDGIGSLYVNVTDGSLYIATGVTSADWAGVGGIAADVGSAVGVSLAQGGVNVLGGVDRDTPPTGAVVLLSDAYAQWNGNGAGLRVLANGTDGQQSLTWTNAAGTWSLVTIAGSIGAPPGGIFFPSSDPHIAGAWWDNAGLLTKSLG